MPESLPTINANVTRIDAPFPEMWGEQFHSLITELQGIQGVMGALSTNLRESIQSTNALSETYSSEGGSVKASRANAEESYVNALDQNSNAFYRTGLAEEGQRINPTPGQQPSEAPAKKVFELPEMPQYYGGHYTTQDLLKIAGQSANWLQEGAGMEGAPEGAGWHQRLQAHIPSGTSEALEGIGGGLEFGTKTTPYISLAGQYFNQGLTRLTGQPVSGPFALSDQMKSIGQSLGYQNVGANNATTLGPFGFVPPIINPQSWGGITQTLGSFGESLSTPGLTTEQSLSFKQAAKELGWKPSQAAGRSMNHVLAELNITSSELAENSEVHESMDKATRFGVTSLKQWLATMKQIPEAAEKANTSVAKMVSELGAYGTLNESRGGTWWGGYKEGLGASAVTGMPPAAIEPLFKSPWAVAQTFRETGQPEWLQGSLPEGVKTQAGLKAFFLAAKTVGNPSAKHFKTPGGFESTQSSISQKAAMMQKFMVPGMGIPQIENLLRQGEGSTLNRVKMNSEAEAWLNETEGRFHHRPHGVSLDRWQEMQDKAVSGSLNQPGTFGHLLQDMAHQREENGRRMFSQEDIKNLRTNSGKGYTSHGRVLAQEKEEAVRELLKTKAGKVRERAGSPENEVMIELSPAAKKLLRLSNGKEVEKLKINAGSGGNTNALSTGYTESLSPTGHASEVAASNINE